MCWNWNLNWTPKRLKFDDEEGLKSERETIILSSQIQFVTRRLQDTYKFGNGYPWNLKPLFT